MVSRIFGSGNSRSYADNLSAAIINFRPACSMTTYSTSGATAKAKFDGSVHGVVVHANKSSPDESSKPTVSAGS